MVDQAKVRLLPCPRSPILPLPLPAQTSHLSAKEISRSHHHQSVDAQHQPHCLLSCFCFLREILSSDSSFNFPSLYSCHSLQNNNRHLLLGAISRQLFVQHQLRRLRAEGEHTENIAWTIHSGSTACRKQARCLRFQHLTKDRFPHSRIRSPSALSFPQYKTSPLAQINTFCLRRRCHHSSRYQDHLPRSFGGKLPR